jgi:uncharacterized membrane protein
LPDRIATRAAVRPWQWAALIGMVTIAWAVFASTLVAQHRAYNSNAFDLGFFDQIIWNTSHGRWFQTSFVEYTFLGQHMQPVLLLFAGLYRVYPSVEIPLVVQATVAAWAAVPLFIAARHLLASAMAALLVAGAYLIAPHLHGAVLFDFHPEVMGAAGIFGALALLAAGRPGWAMVALASVILLKEDAALAGIGFSIVVWVLGYRRTAVALFVASFLYLIVVAGVLMPAIRDGPGDLQERYGYLGTDGRTAVSTALRRPDLVASHLAGEPQRGALGYILAATALLPLATPAGLAAAPSLAANLLSTHPAQHGLTLHYPALSYALLIVAALLGVRSLSRSRRVRRLHRRLRLLDGDSATALAGLLLAASMVAWALGSPLGPRMFDGDRYQRTAHNRAVDRVIAAVPSGAPVSAQSGLLAHLSQRRDVWEFPRLESAEYVVVDRTAWRSSQAEGAGFERTLNALPSLGYCPVLTDDGVTLYRRSGTCAPPS